MFLHIHTCLLTCDIIRLGTFNDYKQSIARQNMDSEISDPFTVRLIFLDNNQCCTPKNDRLKVNVNVS